jgi:hypothetical protein
MNVDMSFRLGGVLGITDHVLCRAAIFWVSEEGH